MWTTKSKCWKTGPQERVGEVVTLAEDTQSELRQFITRGVYYLRCLTLIVNLTGFKTTVETFLWACP